MADDITLNTQRASTGRLGSLTQTGNLEAAVPPAADPGAKKAGTDSLKITPQALQSAGTGFQTDHVKELAKSVGAVQNEQKLITDYQARITSLIPGGVQFDTESGGHWSSQDLKGLVDVVEAMSPTDRQTLSGIRVVRAGKVELGKGGETAIASTMGQGIGSAAEATALGAARIDAEPEHAGLSAKFKDFVIHSADVLEGIPVLRLFGKFLKNMFGQPAPERAIVLGNSGTMIPKEVWVQEIGHQIQMANRGWNPEKIAEFAKLSNWTEDFGDGKQHLADGIDHRTGMRMNFAPEVLKAGRQDNMVSKYAATSPVEDFAETYKAFILDPKRLMQLAPDKFAYLNAQSQRYNASEVKGFALQTGTDLQAVATELVLHSGLKQDTLNAIMTVNGLMPDKSAIRSDAAGSLRGGDPLSQAWAKITTEAQDPAGARRLLENPQEALGDLWPKLAPAEQAILADPTFMKAQLAGLQTGFAGTRSSSDATELEVQRHATATFMNRLLSDPGFQATLASDPTRALADKGLDKTLPADVVAAFAQNPGAVKQLAGQIQSVYDRASQADQQRYAQNLAKALPALSPEHFSAFAASLNNKQDESAAAKQLQRAMESGSLVIQDAGGPPNT